MLVSTNSVLLIQQELDALIKVFTTLPAPTSSKRTNSAAQQALSGPEPAQHQTLSLTTRTIHSGTSSKTSTRSLWEVLPDIQQKVSTALGQLDQSLAMLSEENSTMLPECKKTVSKLNREARRVFDELKQTVGHPRSAQIQFFEDSICARLSETIKKLAAVEDKKPLERKVWLENAIEQLQFAVGQTHENDVIKQTNNWFDQYSQEIKAADLQMLSEAQQIHLAGLLCHPVKASKDFLCILPPLVSQFRAIFQKSRDDGAFLKYMTEAQLSEETRLAAYEVGK